MHVPKTEHSWNIHFFKQDVAILTVYDDVEDLYSEHLHVNNTFQTCQTNNKLCYHCVLVDNYYGATAYMQFVI